ncbi:MAG TPA: MmcQ/YjbR family DNA-binding protein [Solirubrobacterales bacterium]|nr:MmcQ/YjbR family DNA-binding protein [Solirubrobacterales bacterium]
MDAAALRRQCLSFAGAEETFPFGPETSVFKVRGRMFALSRFDPEDLRVSLKCEPRLAENLRAVHPEVIPGYHLNKQHWNTVILGGKLADTAIRDMIEDSYDLVVSKLPAAERKALGWDGRL